MMYDGRQFVLLIKPMVELSDASWLVPLQPKEEQK